MLGSSELTWVNVGDPSTKKRNSRLRKEIRAHVTRLQHKKRQEDVLNQRRMLQVNHTLWPEDGNPALDSAFTSDQEVDSCTRLIVGRLIEEEEYIEQQVRDIVYAPTLPSVTKFEAESSEDNASPQPQFLHDPYDDLDYHLRRLGANASDTLRYYSYVVDCQADHFEETYSLPHGWAKPNIMSYLTTDYTLLTAVSMICITSMRSANARLSAQTGVDLIRMRALAIKLIQQAMHDQSNAVSDQLILAVNFFAGYEAIYGSAESYHVHMRGLRDMILLRGGLTSLGADGLVEFIILYYDTNSAGLMRCSPYLDRLPSTRFTPYNARKDSFLSGLTAVEHHYADCHLDEDTRKDGFGEVIVFTNEE